MIPKRSKLHSIITGSCPRCHLESMYKTKNPYVITETLKMQNRCSHCSLAYQIEPSFFYGSMYVSYGVGIAFAVVAFVISYIIFKSSLFVSIIWIVISIVALSPINMRLSRNIWINLFIKYDSSLAQKSMDIDS